jgi:uncharacterized protein (TIGR02147 family)
VSLDREGEGGEDLSWFQSQARMPLEEAEVRRALKLLRQLKLIERDGESRWRPSGDLIFPKNAGPEFRAKIRETLKERIRYGAEELGKAPAEEAKYMSLLLPVRLKDLPTMQRKIQRFWQDFADSFESRDGDEVYAMQLQLFPMTSSKPSSED